MLGGSESFHRGRGVCERQHTVDVGLQHADFGESCDGGGAVIDLQPQHPEPFAGHPAEKATQDREPESRAQVASSGRERDRWTVNTVHELLPGVVQDDTMVRAGIVALGEWLDVSVSAW